jgi:hypothetical protein
MYAFVSRLERPVLRNGSRGIRGIVEGVWWCHLAAGRSPVGTAGRKRLGDGGGSGLYGTSTKHNTASEDSRLSAIVIGHLVP